MGLPALAAIGGMIGRIGLSSAIRGLVARGMSLVGRRAAAGAARAGARSAARSTARTASGKFARTKAVGRSVSDAAKQAKAKPPVRPGKLQQSHVRSSQKQWGEPQAPPRQGRQAQRSQQRTQQKAEGKQKRERERRREDQQQNGDEEEKKQPRRRTLSDYMDYAFPSRGGAGSSSSPNAPSSGDGSGGTTMGAGGGGAGGTGDGNIGGILGRLADLISARTSGGGAAGGGISDSDVLGHGSNFGDIMAGKKSMEDARQEMHEDELADQHQRNVEKLKKSGGLMLGVPVAIVGMVKAMNAFSATMVARQRELTVHHGGIATAIGMLDVRRHERNIQRAGATFSSTVQLAGQQNQLEKALQPWRIASTNTMNKIAEHVAWMAAGAAKITEEIPLIKGLLARAGAYDDKDVDVPWAKFIDKAAAGDLETPLDERPLG